MKLRRRAVVKWTGAAVCALILGAWFVSRWFVVGVLYRQSGTSTEALLRGGCLELARLRWSDLSLNREADGWSFDCGPMATWAVGWTWLPERVWTSTTLLNARAIAVPLYFPFVLLFLPTAWLFYRDRRSVRWGRAGRCVGCGYDLAGSPSGVCPECGKTAISTGPATHNVSPPVATAVLPAVESRADQ